MRASEEVAKEISDEYRARYEKARHELVEAGRVRDFLLAMDESAELAPGAPVPALFMLTMGRTRRPMPSSGGSVNAGDDYEFFAPVFVGDTITVERQVLGVDERQGKKGRVFLVRAQTSYTNQHGTLVARALMNTLRMGI